ncbi:MAG: heparinase II/III family protein [Firmicutes bacterium]|nr:heparinase II/III family protein [Bacillota bacterium]
MDRVYLPNFDPQEALGVRLAQLSQADEDARTEAVASYYAQRKQPVFFSQWSYRALVSVAQGEEQHANGLQEAGLWELAEQYRQRRDPVATARFAQLLHEMQRTHAGEQGAFEADATQMQRLASQLLGALPASFDAFCASGAVPAEVTVNLLAIIERSALTIEADLDRSAAAIASGLLEAVEAAMEGAALYTTGSLFFELREAAQWREKGASLLDQAKVQFAEGGEPTAQLPTVALLVFALYASLAVSERLNGKEAHPQWEELIGVLYRFLDAIADPQGYLPPVGESPSLHFALLKERVSEACRVAGLPLPSDSSQNRFAVFQRAGVAAYKGGSSPYAPYFFFDASPRILLEQHADGLNVLLHAYGAPLLVEGGPSDLAEGKWANYFPHTVAHNAALVDGAGQRYGYRSAEALSEIWQQAGWSAVSASYRGGFDVAGTAKVEHRRTVVLVQWPVFHLLIWDRFLPEDGAEHRYTLLFHVRSKKVQLAGEALRFFGEPGMYLYSRTAGNLERNVVSGLTEPRIQGWYLPAGASAPRPLPTAQVSTRGTTVDMLTLLLPLPTEAESPLFSWNAGFHSQYLQATTRWEKVALQFTFHPDETPLVEVEIERAATV